MAISQKTDRGVQLADKVPNTGWIRCRPGGLTAGVGRWDDCGLEQCNKRMWHILDTHGARGHTCDDCRPRAKGAGRGTPRPRQAAPASKKSECELSCVSQLLHTQGLVPVSFGQPDRSECEARFLQEKPNTAFA